MNANDAIQYLIENFNLTRIGADWSGALDYDLSGTFDFTVAEVDNDTLRLVAPLPELAEASMASLAASLLQANLQGEETGMGQIGLHPDQGIALIEIVDTRGLEFAGLELRIYNFSLCVEYWRNGGASGYVVHVNGPEAPTLSGEEIIFRL